MLLQKVSIDWKNMLLQKLSIDWKNMVLQKVSRFYYNDNHKYLVQFSLIYKIQYSLRFCFMVCVNLPSGREGNERGREGQVVMIR